ELFENTTILLDHFADLPVVLAAVRQFDPRNQSYRVVVVEKDRGMVRYNQALPGSADFQTVQIDWKNATIDLYRYGLRARPAPEPAASLDPEEKNGAVEEAVDRGLKFLKGEMRKDSTTIGHWEGNNGIYRSTVTPLTAMAFLMEGSTLREGKYSDEISRD